MSVQLRRVAGLPTVIATAVGLPFAALEYLAAALLTTYVAGDSAWIPMIVAGLLVLIAWAFFSELNGMFPSAAAILLWMSKAMDARIALTVALTYLTTIIVVMAADAYIVGVAITHTLGEAKWAAPLWVTAVLTLASVANLRGIVVAGRTEALVTSVVIVATIAVSVVALAKGGFHLRAPLSPLRHHSGSDLIQSVAIGIFLYAAFEWTTTIAEEVRAPAVVIPRGMLISIGVMLVTCALLSVAMGHVLHGSQLTGPYPQLLLGIAAIGKAGLYGMMGVTALTALNTFNGGFLTASRFVYATARQGSLPQRFARLNTRAVPWLAVTTIAGLALACALVVAVTGSWQVLIAVGAALEVALYSAAGVTVYRLRKRAPAERRPFAVRGGAPLVIAGAALFALLGVAASITVGRRTDVAPLVIIVVLAALSAGYVVLWAPRVRRAEEGRRAAAAARRRERRLKRVDDEGS